MRAKSGFLRKVANWNSGSTIAAMAFFLFVRTSALANPPATQQPMLVNGSVQITIFLTSGTTWTVPVDWNNANNTIETIGAGGGGFTFVSTTYPAGGGGAAYSKSVNQTLTPSSTVGIAVGSGGAAGTAGGDTWLCNLNSNCATIEGTAVISGAK